MFKDRNEAGDRLAEALAALAPKDPVILALPRGGVPVAERVAARLGAPLDLLLVRKIGVPGHEELAAGAVLEDAEPVFNESVLAMIGRQPSAFEETVARKRREIAARRELYLGTRDPEPLTGRTAIVVDDGIATGATVRAALTGLKARGAASVILAVPVAPQDTLAELGDLVDRVVCLETPEPFYAVGAHYVAFPQVPDGEVVAAMRRAARAAEGKDDG